MFNIDNYCFALSIITNQIKAASKNVKKTGVFRQRECICYNISEGKLCAKKSMLALETQLKKKRLGSRTRRGFLNVTSTMIMAL